MSDIQIEYMDVQELKPAPYNPRIMDDAERALLEKGLQEYGFVEPLVWNELTGHVVGGNQRLLSAINLGMDKVPVVRISVTLDREKALNLALNKISGEFVLPAVKDILEEIDTGAFDIELTGYSTLEIEDLMTQYHVEPDIDEDEVPAPPENPITKPGDLYILGDHRLLCGDATRQDDVARLLDGAKPFLMVTDPPYGVEYDPQWRQNAAEKGHLAYGVGRFGKVQHDDNSGWLEAYKLFPGEVLYVWHASASQSAVQFAIDIMGCDFIIRNQIIWKKPTFAISRGHYHWQHEPCWYAVRKGAGANWIGDRSQSTVWEISNRQDDHSNHGTQKPVECMARPIRNHKASEVYDPFVGSGTTIIACEQLGRKCYAMEIDPVYCDVAVQRWENLTGRKAGISNERN